MTPALPRTNFHGSTLIRHLADLAVVDAAEPVDGFAEKLGQWIHFADAITLSAVHAEAVRGSRAMTGAPLNEIRVRAAAEFDRMRNAMQESIAKSFSPDAGKSHIKLPTLLPELPLEPKTAYPPYRRFYAAHQRDMELGLQPLRVNLREALAKSSARGAKLAELDATFEKILRERESRLLARVPALLARRFGQLVDEHRQALAAAGQDDNPAGWMKPGGWLARFCGDMRTLLLAELELRLQPAMGLMEALNQDTQ
ncbi:DUF3348 family protein [Noviherbaspirillum aridicola]|uniref:DUF3348 family protein n=1 Tax=Noviherbaspirillum aridicola TaxID=2849687 RepID=A0ABQ4Q0F2_9BURK|nr:DUF3348 family protein [Noviherbaspirillum aridicola]GIZ50260.1 hypothetical protein NCCP691_02740 [Noviherbaspirillum aridicola]